MRTISKDTLDETEDGGGISEPSSALSSLRTPGATPPSSRHSTWQRYACHLCKIQW